MKKGFTMIELIFVIVILGILASVAIPRLAATREDAEIATTVANLRTLVSEASAYYVAHGTFTTGEDGVKWNEITKVPLENPDQLAADSGRPGYITVDGERCIEVQIHNKIGPIPARISFTENPRNRNRGICSQALAAEPIRAFTQSTIRVGRGILPNTMAIGSTSRIYE
ncbi:prepilin-type N-terminal cleavage/methylation domain-containing protein [Campylobacter sp.]|uniref:type II secretion system protein n=1 Tax=Campylobacter sp. TaxID=205 RepID=UPI002A825486|nr:prepilin-type N-terminal cleavage/methylation domain-containing protein [Campylobacter sp.]MDY4445953.1 prepilin-type N-terminal cleavage/methylation domain-containing protein [Campylobacter sp.]